MLFVSQASLSEQVPLGFNAEHQKVSFTSRFFLQIENEKEKEKMTSVRKRKARDLVCTSFSSYTVLAPKGINNKRFLSCLLCASTIMQLENMVL